METTGGTGQILWFRPGGGRFPIGFTMDGFTGGLDGRPLLEGDFTFDVKLVDACNVETVEPVSIQVVPSFPLADAKRNAFTDEFAEGGDGAPVTRFVELLAGSRLDGTFRLVGRGKLAESNAQQVTKARQIIEGLGLEVANPDEAREILELKGGDKVAF